ncbi:MAG: DUF2339 domain-containing protein [Xanthomonadales bacterium]|nr:DUF2339 domain-containing protein [Xanthomonadales bacterium]
MEGMLILVGLFLLIYLLLGPLLAMIWASNANRRAEQLTRLNEGLLEQLNALRDEMGRWRARAEAAASTPVETDSRSPAEAPPVAERAPPAAARSVPVEAEVVPAEVAPVAAPELVDPNDPGELAESLEAWSEALPEPLPSADMAPSVPSDSAAIELPEAPEAPVSGRARYDLGAEPQSEWLSTAPTTPTAATAPTAAPAPRPPPPRPRPPAPPPEPPAWQVAFGKAWGAAREWLFGGNLVAKVGLAILFIGVAFLLRYASSYVVVPIELRLAGIAAGAIALLLWGWRIRLSRPGIALPAQGAALATLMLVSFGAFKLYHLLPAGFTFVLLLLLVVFTCLLAVLQDARWLAIFGIVGGFAVPILTSTGEGSHVALFSYYAVLNAGILAIAWYRSWRSLNVLGFAFTFIIGTIWGVQRYEPAHYASSQSFLALFLVFYVAIAVLYARREAPRLRSYVDGTLVFGVPTVAMGLQYGLVKDFELGPALSAVALGLFYAGSAGALWRWRGGGLRLLTECFFALAVVFGTLAIPLAFDGRWTSAAWALEGAGITWIGLRQRQPLVWRFGMLVQLGSWLAFLKALTGIDALTALGQHFSLGFLLLGATGVFVALLLRPSAKAQAEGASAAKLPWLGSVFLCVAVAWLLGGLWLEVWLRVDAAARGGLLVLSAFALVLGLQWLAGRVGWRLPALLGGLVSALAGVVFLALMFRYMRWRDLLDPAEHTLAEMLSEGGLLGGTLLTAAALVSALGFLRRSREDSAVDGPSKDARAAGGWLLLAMFWSAGFALHGLAHLLAWATRAPLAEAQTLYAIGFWPAYGVGLALLGWGWHRLAQHWHFPNRMLVSGVLWPLATLLGGWAFLRSQAAALPGYETLLDFDAIVVATAGIVWPLLGGPLLGGLLLALVCWQGLRWCTRADTPLADDQRRLLQVGWWLALSVACFVPVLVPLTRAIAAALVPLAAAADVGAFSLADIYLLTTAALALLALRLGRSPERSALRWLVLPTALWQIQANLLLLGQLYVHQRLPGLATGVAMLGLWAALLVSLRQLRNDPGLPRPALQLAHFGRVIAPWLMLPAVLSLNVQQWLRATPVDASEWIVAGQWGDYLAAWLAIGLLLLGLRQVRRQAWPLAPLADWYGRLIIPLAALWALLLVIYWNLRQDGSMAPLPYLPLLNPIDLSTAFVALLLVDLWRLHAGRLGEASLRPLRWLALALAFGWFNAILLRTAAQYLPLPYRFDALYASQFVQAMLSLAWTLCAFALMRFAVRRLSRVVWIIGAVLLGLVVLKLFLVELKHIGGIARIVSFMGVGGLMLLIGYLAPLPRAAEANPTENDA